MHGKTLSTAISLEQELLSGLLSNVPASEHRRVVWNKALEITDGNEVRAEYICDKVGYPKPPLEKSIEVGVKGRQKSTIAGALKKLGYASFADAVNDLKLGDKEPSEIEDELLQLAGEDYRIKAIRRGIGQFRRRKSWGRWRTRQESVRNFLTRLVEAKGKKRDEGAEAALCLRLGIPPRDQGIPYDKQLDNAGLIELRAPYYAYRLKSKADRKNLNRYTAFAWWGEDGAEEIDIDAANETEAKLVAERALYVGYMPNWTKLVIKQRPVGWSYA